MSNAVVVKRNKDREVSLQRRLLAGSVGALLTSLLLTPLDVIKTRLQLNQTRIACKAKKCAYPKCSLYVFCNGLMDHLLPPTKGPYACAHPDPPREFKSASDAFLKILRYEGVGSLYSGLAPTLWMSIPATVLYFSFYDILRLRLRDNGYAWTAPIIAGCSARTVAQTVVSPLELIRTQIQGQALKEGIMIGIRSNINESGFFGLWRGLLPTLLRDVPFSGIYWSGYEVMKNWLINEEEQISTNQKFIRTFASGATAGAFAAVLVTPMDVSKTRTQVGTSKGPQSMITILREIVAVEGVRGAFAGLTARLVRIPPACAVMISSYEICKSFTFLD